MSNKSPLHRMLNPESVAFVGANNSPTTMGTVQLLNTINAGFKGKLYPVHPKEKTVLGLKAYPSIRDIPGPVDFAAITIPARIIPKIFEDCGAKGVLGAVVTSGGFAELGDEGKELEREILGIAQKNNIRFIGPNCLGILNPHCNLNVTMFPYNHAPGAMGLASQSGTYVTQVIHYLERRGIGFSKALSIGNKADLDLVDYLEYLGEDPDTKSIALYIEGVKRPRLFLETAQKVSRIKPIVALYVGGTEAGARSSASHTGAICTPAKLFSDVLRQAGVIEAKTIEDLYYWSWTLATQPIPKSNRVAILTHSGGPATSIADTSDRLGIEIPPLSQETMDALKPLVPPTANVGNPVDLTYFPDTVALADTLPEIILKDPNIDGLIIHGLMITSWISGINEAGVDFFETVPLEKLEQMIKKPIEELSKLPEKFGKPVIGSTFMGPNIEAATRIMHKNRIPNFDGPEKAATAMAALVRYRRIKERNGGA